MAVDNTAFINKIGESSYAGWNALEYTKGAPEIYISFKTLLEWTSQNVNLFSDGLEIIDIDYESDKPMFMYSTTISCNLDKCYLHNPYLSTSPGTFTGTVASAFNPIGKFIDPKFIDLQDALLSDAGTFTGLAIYPTVGNINNIYLNTTYLSNLLNKKSDNALGKVSIREYLQAICDGVNKALGSINDFKVISDVDGSSEHLTIVDYQQVRIRGLATAIVKRDTTLIKAQGLGSMLTSIAARSTITPDLATIISIGAQAQGEVLGEEAVSFSRLSTGLLDRVYPEKVIGRTAKELAAKNAIEREQRAQERFGTALESYMQLIDNQRPANTADEFGTLKISPDETVSLENIPAELYKYILSHFTETHQTRTGFIPVKLDITLPGLSGIKIFQKFTLSKDVLPLSYQEDYEFTITGVSHEVSSTGWVTSIASIMGLAEKKVETGEGFAIPLSNLTQVSSNSGTANNLTFSPSISEYANNATVLKKGAEIAKSLVTALNISKIQAAAIVGNFMAESGLDPDRKQNFTGGQVLKGPLVVDATTGYGYAQWTNRTRQQALYDFAKTKGIDPKTTNLTDKINTDFAIEEFKSASFKGVLTSLKATKTIQEATNSVLRKYEMPYNMGQVALEARTANAQAVLDQMT